MRIGSVFSNRLDPDPDQDSTKYLDPDSVKTVASVADP
jgi:hypothetical protein